MSKIIFKGEKLKPQPLDIKHRKEDNFFKQTSFLVMVDGQPKEVLIIRHYCTQLTVYCCIWFSGWVINKDSWSCSAKSGGYGYDKTSDSTMKALRNKFDCTCLVEYDTETVGRELLKQIYNLETVFVVSAHG